MENKKELLKEIMVAFNLEFVKQEEYQPAGLKLKRDDDVFSYSCEEEIIIDWTPTLGFIGEMELMNRGEAYLESITDPNIIEMKNIYGLVQDMDLSLDEMWSIIHEYDLGNLDAVNSREIIESYLEEMMKKGVHVSHILASLEENYDTDFFGIWLGNSMENAEPIRTKEELKNYIL